MSLRVTDIVGNYLQMKINFIFQHIIVAFYFTVWNINITFLVILEFMKNF